MFISGYYINTTKGNAELTIFNRLSSRNCSQSFLTLMDFISCCLSIRLEKITTLRLINLCPYIEMTSLEKLQSIRRLIFDNCTIDFLASPQREDYDLYPRNLSRWIFNQGHTNTFEQFITMINHLGKTMNIRFSLQWMFRSFEVRFTIDKLFPTD